MGKDSFYARYIKRVLDVVCAAAFLILFWWVYVIIALLVRINLGSPVIYRQPRPGKDGEIFHMIKFRSMTDETDEQGKPLPDDQRLTRFGRLLRSTSLDELPEIWLILTGKLSVCGPRPLLVKYLPRYSQEQARRHEVTPGLTGWAQVNGRNTISWEQKFVYDVWYVDHVSLALDLKILFMTVEKVFRRDGISSETSVTMEEFMGSEEKGNE